MNAPHPTMALNRAAKVIGLHELISMLQIYTDCADDTLRQKPDNETLTALHGLLYNSLIYMKNYEQSLSSIERIHSSLARIRLSADIRDIKIQ